MVFEASPLGLACRSGDLEILLDPRSSGEGYNFVSHAHADHLPRGARGLTVCSEQTEKLAAARGRALGPRCDLPEASLHDAGHVLGSRGLLLGGDFYTGDICTRDRGFLRGARVPRCRTLLTECTFGLPEFVFPPVAQTRKLVDELISRMYSRGAPVVLMGYQLGKSQTLADLFGHWDPMYLHDSLLGMHELHRALGAPLKERAGHSEATARGLLRRRPWVMVSPVLGEQDPFVRSMRSYGAVTVGFSGWYGSGRFGVGRRCDYSFPLSDHCDFPELVRMVVRSGAQKVLTVHGFVEEFAAHLRSQGIDASPMSVPARTRRTRTR